MAKNSLVRHIGKDEAVRIANYRRRSRRDSLDVLLMERAPGYATIEEYYHGDGSRRRRHSPLKMNLKLVEDIPELLQLVIDVLENRTGVPPRQLAARVRTALEMITYG